MSSKQQLQKKLRNKLKESMLKSKIIYSQNSEKYSESGEKVEKRNRTENSKKLSVMEMEMKGNQSLSKGLAGTAATGTAVLVAKKSLKKMSKLQAKMASKLSGSKFRWLNETLYTAKSESSFELFSREPELFSIYH